MLRKLLHQKSSRVLAALLCAASLLFASQAAAQIATPQFAEDSVEVQDLDGGAPTEVCVENAPWLRLGFQSLVLLGGDSLELTSSGGDSVTFAGTRWNARSFHTAALRGDCITITPHFTDEGSAYALSESQAGTLPLEETRADVAGAGDLCDSTPKDCGKTADLIVAIDPIVALAVGDLAYSSGKLTEFMSRYEPYWGRFKPLTMPVPGNHEYMTTNASGYFDYFNGVGVATGQAGKRTEGWYSYDVGEWHFIALNSKSAGAVSATQLAWLDADLRANTKRCTAAYMHHPYVSSGRYSTFPNLRPIVERLYASKVDLLIGAHDHGYQRFAKMDADQVARDDGFREVIVGTGGGDLYTIAGTHPLFEVGNGSAFGVLHLDLGATGFAAAFVPVKGKTWTDAFEGTCHRAGGIVGDYILTATPTISIPRGSSGAKVVTVASYGAFNDGVKIAVTGLPTGVTATIGTLTVTPPADGSATSRITLRPSTSAILGSYPITATGTFGTGETAVVRAVKFTLTVK